MTYGYSGDGYSDGYSATISPRFIWFNNQSVFDKSLQSISIRLGEGTVELLWPGGRVDEDGHGCCWMMVGDDEGKGDGVTDEPPVSIGVSRHGGTGIIVEPSTRNGEEEGEDFFLDFVGIWLPSVAGDTVTSPLDTTTDTVSVLALLDVPAVPTDPVPCVIEVDTFVIPVFSGSKCCMLMR